MPVSTHACSTAPIDTHQHSHTEPDHTHSSPPPALTCAQRHSLIPHHQHPRTTHHHHDHHHQQHSLVPSSLKIGLKASMQAPRKAYMKTKMMGIAA